MLHRPQRSGVFTLLLALAASPSHVAGFVGSPLLLRRVGGAQGALGLRPDAAAGVRYGMHHGLRMAADGAAPDGPAAVQDAPVIRPTARVETGYSNANVLGDAIREALRDAAAKLPEGAAPHAVLLFVNTLYCNDGLLGEMVATKDGRDIRAGNEKYGKAIGLIARQLSQRGWTDMPVVGMSVGGNVCDDKDYEGADGGAGIGISLMYVPGSTVMPFTVPTDMDESWKPNDWKKTGLDPDGFTKPSLTPPYTPADDAVMFVFAHPESTAFTRKVLDSLDFAFPRAKKVGAIAGQALENHEAALFMLPNVKNADLNSDDSAWYDTGVVGLAVSGDIAVDAVVAQGSRPIGPNYEVLETEMNGTVVTRMRDVSTGAMTEGPPTTLFDMAGFAGMIDQADVVSAVNYIALGISVTPLEEDVDKHQYIVRPVTDLQKDGPISLGDQVRVGQVVRFHVRDDKNAEAELTSLRARWKLERASRALDGKYPAGALVFADQARGRKLFGREKVEAEGFAKDFPGIPLGGAFVNGAIGQLPNFGSSSAFDENKKPLFKDGTGTPKRVGVLFDQLEKGTFLHGVGSSYVMIYGKPEQE